MKFTCVTRSLLSLFYTIDNLYFYNFIHINTVLIILVSYFYFYINIGIFLIIPFYDQDTTESVMNLLLIDSTTRLQIKNTIL